jgi:hypothetical protein
MGKHFAIGDRISISDDFFWAKGALGTVGEPPAEVISIGGRWDGITRVERSALGENIVYWINFDEPQFDADGDGPYRAGSIWETALSTIEPT